jgi:hypothetical protein
MGGLGDGVEFVGFVGMRASTEGFWFSESSEVGFWGSGVEWVVLEPRGMFWGGERGFGFGFGFGESRCVLWWEPG